MARSRHHEDYPLVGWIHSDGMGIYDLNAVPIEEIQAYLKTKGLGTFNLSLPFHYIPKE